MAEVAESFVDLDGDVYPGPATLMLAATDVASGCRGSVTPGQAAVHDGS